MRLLLGRCCFGLEHAHEVWACVMSGVILGLRLRAGVDVLTGAPGVCDGTLDRWRVCVCVHDRRFVCARQAGTRSECGVCLGTEQ